MGEGRREEVCGLLPPTLSRAFSQVPRKPCRPLSRGWNTLSQSQGPVYRAQRQRPGLSAADRPGIVLCGSGTFSHLYASAGRHHFRTRNCRAERFSEMPTSSSRQAQSWVCSGGPRWVRLSAHPSKSLWVCTPHPSFSLAQGAGGL